MQCLEVSGAVRPIYGSLGVKRLTFTLDGHECLASRPVRFDPGKGSWYQFNWRLEGPQNLSGPFGEERIHLLLLEFEPRASKRVFNC